MLSIDAILVAYLSLLQAEIARADALLALKEVATSGKPLEVGLKAFLQRVLPGYVRISRGKIIDSKGAISDEIDLILYDSRYFPGFGVVEYGPDEFRLIPVTSVLAVISAKKTLTLDTLKQAFQNLSSVYNLERPVITNRLHYDVVLPTNFEFMGGVQSNPILSAVVGHSDDLFTCVENKQKRRMTEDEADAYAGRLWAHDWYEGSRVDFIYCIEGFLFSPMTFSTADNAWKRTGRLECVGQPKIALRPWRDESGVQHIDYEALTRYYCLDKREPHKVLSAFLHPLLQIISRIVTSSPDLADMFPLTIPLRPTVAERSPERFPVSTAQCGAQAAHLTNAAADSDERRR